MDHPGSPERVDVELNFTRNSSKQIMLCRSGIYYRMRVTATSYTVIAIELGGLIAWRCAVNAGTHEIPIEVEGTSRSHLHYRLDLIVSHPDYRGSHFDAYVVTSRVCRTLSLCYVPVDNIQGSDQMNYDEYTAYIRTLPLLKFSVPKPEPEAANQSHALPNNGITRTFFETGIYTKFTISTPTGCEVDICLGGYHIRKHTIASGTQTVLLDPPIVYDEELAAKSGLADYEFRVAVTGQVSSFDMKRIPLAVTRPETYNNS